MSEIINAYPTKKLFIDILTRDINVRDCILDLVDNSVDSYIRHEFTERKEIKLQIADNYFEIFDNCGGINKDFLRENVFRFGAENLFKDKPTLGMYGIGLKRAIFKLGKDIVFETDDGDSNSIVSFNVEEWKNKRKENGEDDWSIPLESSKSKVTKENAYTRLQVRNLYSEINTKLNIEAFINDLRAIIGKYYCLIINDGIDFYINDVGIPPFPFEYKVNSQFKPQTYKEEFDEVNIEILCYINTSKDRLLKGWNLFCNKRLILSNDTSSITGWSGNGDMLPKFHPSFNQFTGIVFLNSDNPFNLPLKTTKDGLNTEHRTYQHVLNKMVQTARPIVNYLSSKYRTQLDEEKEIEDQIIEAEDDEIIEEEVQSYKISDIIKEESNFSAPERIPRIPHSIIQYEKPRSIVERLKTILEVNSNKAVGEKTFEYFTDMEGIEDE